ncbi:MAG: phosphoglucosamine mutase, partial [Eubacterium sp.]
TLSSLQFMKALAASGKKVSELADEIVMYPQVLVNAKVSTENKKIFMRDSEIRQAIADAEAAVGSDGRVLIRPSGTEPLARVMIEGKDIEQIRALAEDIADLISSKYE